MIEAVYSNRSLNLVSYQVIHEWEDILCSELDVPLVNKNEFVGEIARYLYNKKTYNYINNSLKYTNTDRTNIAFMMCIQDSRYFIGKNNVLPILIDFWEYEVELFCRIFKKSKMVYLSSLEAVIAVNKIKGTKPQVRFLPMSISDIYKTDVVPEKQIDIIQIGRANPVFDAYIYQLLRKYPNLNYVCKKLVGDKFYWFSSVWGELGEMNTRYEYMSLLSKCKISLVSSPGMDNVRNTGKFDPVTPRFFESAVNLCHMLGRYTVNADYTYFKIPEICKNISDYEQFEQEVMSLRLSSPSALTDYYKDFLDSNYTSKRAHQIISDLAVLN